MDVPYDRPAPPRLRSSRSRVSSHTESRPHSRQSAPETPKNNRLTRAAFRDRLRSLLSAKDDEISLAGRLGERLIAQQSALSSRIRSLEDELGDSEPVRSRNRHPDVHELSEDDSVDDNLRGKLEAFEAESKNWGSENDELFRLVSAKAVDQNIDDTDTDDHTSVERPQPSDSLSRRTRNNSQHRAADVEFATEIGQALLEQIRQLQAVVAHKDATINEVVADRDLKASALRQLEESMQSLKDENWNLEVAAQELRSNLTDNVARLQKSESERARLTKLAAKTSESLEQARTENINLKRDLDAVRGKHETDLANMRKMHAGLQRERSDLQTTLEGVRTELDNEKRRPRPGLRPNNSSSSTLDSDADITIHHDDDEDKTRTPRRKTGDALPHFYSPGDSDDSFLSSSLTSQDPTDASSTNASTQDLAHLRRTIVTLRQALTREKEARMRLEKQNSNTENDGPPSPIARNFTARGGRGGRGRRGGLATGPSRLGKHSFSEQGEDDIEEDVTEDSDRSQDLQQYLEHASFDTEQSILSTDDQFDASGFSQAPSISQFVARQTADAEVMTDPFPIAQSAGVSTQTSSEEISRADASMSTDSTIYVSEQNVQTDPPVVIAFEEIGIQASTVTENRPPRLFEDASVNVDHKIHSSESITQTDIPTPTSFTDHSPYAENYAHYTSTEKLSMIISPVSDSFATASPASTSVDEFENFGSLQGEGTRSPILPTIRESAPSEPSEAAESEANESFADPTGTAAVIDTSNKENETRKLPSGIVIPDVDTLDADVSSIDASPSDVTKSFISLNDNLSDSDSTTLEPKAKRIKRKSVVIEPSTPVPSSSRRHSQHTNLGGSDSGDEHFTDVERFTNTEDGYFTDALETVGRRSPSTFASGSRTPTFHASKGTLGSSLDFSHHNENLSSEILVESETLRALLPQLANAGMQTDYEEPKIVYIETASTPIVPTAKDRDPVPTADVSTQTDIQFPTDSLSSQTGLSALVIKENRRSVGTFGGDSVTPIKSSFDLEQPTPSSDSSSVPRAINNTINIAPSASARERLELQGMRPESELSVASNMLDLTAVAAAQTNNTSNATEKRAIKEKSSVPLDHQSVFGPRSRPFPPPDFLPPPAKNVRRSSNSQPHHASMPPPHSTNRPRAVQSTSSLRVSRQTQFSSSTSTSHSNSEYGKVSIITRPPSAPSTKSSKMSPSLSTKPVPLGVPPTRERRASSTAASMSSMASSRTSEIVAGEGPVPPLPNGGFKDIDAMKGSDPRVIHAITQTMIGEFLYKYTRRRVTKGISEKRHKRFFWIHPYTKTLYWSSRDPGSQHVNESSSKSVFIQNVQQISDPNPHPPGLYHTSILISTRNREIKITAATRERHEMWFNAINYLLNRSAEQEQQQNASHLSRATTPSLFRGGGSREPSIRGTLNRLRSGSLRSPVSSPDRASFTARSHLEPGSIPRKGKKAASSVKRAGTPAAEYLEATSEFGSPTSRRFYENSDMTRSASILSVENMPTEEGDGDDENGTYEGLENLRACCDGRHSLHELTASAKKRHLKYHVARDPHRSPRIQSP